MLDQDLQLEEISAIQRAFSKQAEHYDEDDQSNLILASWRQQVYHHIRLLIKPNSYILELNAGTGIDALELVRSGHSVHATDFAPGMIDEIQKKISRFRLEARLMAQQCSFESLPALKQKDFDYVFSNFGGLNCCKDLGRVARHLPGVLKPGAIVTWVIMPPVSLWELLSIVKGKSTAFRRLTKKGALAQVEEEYFTTYYHRLSDIKRALGSAFEFIKSEGLGVVSPPPASAAFILRHPLAYRLLSRIDHSVCGSFPFNRWADHIITSFRYAPHR